ncbi:DUF1156 domain-containing protein [Actinomadura meridiana]|uniref:DUF1156 domain-containing protein n=1 Tax=Actinomadura meridiana TaxID=559626 RepID=A0ABP8BW02_9ACTN
MSTEPPTYKKKLIEVALPLDEINKQSAREKSIRHGHPSTLHLWWARRPLAACRAVLFAQLVDDPSAHPDKFRSDEDQALERKRLFNIIERLVNWDNINDKALFEEARKEIWKSCDGNPPPILDPFAGGGSIPLEAQRLGLEAHASDLNPVPVLINKALIEIPPKWAGMPPVFPGAADERMGDWPGATGLAEDVRRYGKWMRDEAEKRIGHLYPKVKLEDGTEANVIAWIWARTVTCPNPTCGATMPLTKSFWLSKKNGMERYVEPITSGKDVRFEVRGPEGKPREGTLQNRKATCLVCGSPAKTDYIQGEGRASRMGVKLLAIAAEGRRTRYYVSPSEKHECAAEVDRPEDIPDALLADDPRNIWCANYGLDSFAKLFTNRQLVAIVEFSDLVAEVHDKVIIDTDAFNAGMEDSPYLARSEEYAAAIALYLGFLGSALIDDLSSLVSWRPSHGTGATRSTFSRQSLPMVWDYAESNPFGGAAGDISSGVATLSKAIEALPASLPAGSVRQVDAASVRNQGRLVTTDPPYYDNISYADLSDFFYVWLRRTLREYCPDLLDTMLTPKAQELIANTYRQGGKDEAKKFFEDGYRRMFTSIRPDAPLSFPMAVFYAFKQAESSELGKVSTGWATLLEAMIGAGWSITATWPVRTERVVRMLGNKSNALASSVVLACRPRGEHAPVIDRRGLINKLQEELPAALGGLRQGGIAPVDLAQAAIGPGMAVYSRYSRIMESDGSSMSVRAALALINSILADVLAEQEADFDSDTRFCIKWFETYGFDMGRFGEADTLARAIDTSVAGLDRAGIIKARGGIVQLLDPSELTEEYDPVTDDRISVWEIVMHLAKQFHEGQEKKGGIDVAARLMAAAGSRIDLDAAKELNFLLYSICEKRNWAEMGLLFNDLGTAWSEIEKAAQNAAPIGDIQGSLDYPEED